MTKHSSQVEQALAEKSLAEEYGQVENVKAAEKRLAALGYAAQERKAAAEKSDGVATPPQGRSARKPQTTTKD